MLIKVAMLIVFFAMLLIIGMRAHKSALNVDSFVLGGRSIGPWLSAFAYGTSYFSAVAFVGYAGQFGWKYGISATWIGLGNALIGALLAWSILGRPTRIMTQHLQASTMPEFFGKRFQSKSLKTASSMIIFIFLIPYTASIYNGLSRLFAMAFDVPYMVFVIIMAAFTCVYLILGGYMATAITDFVQGLIMLVGIVLVIYATLSGLGGFSEAINSLAQFNSDIPATLGQPGAFTSFFGPDPANLLGVIILTSLGTWGMPQMIHKFYAIKNEKAIKSGTIISTIFALVVAGGCYFLGSFARLFDNEAIYSADGSIMFDAIMPHILSTLPDIVIGVVIVLVLSASMSTLASLVLTSASTLTLDFLRGNIIKDMGEKAQMRCLRILIVFFIALSVILAINPPIFIAQLMGISWGALAGSFLGPFLYSLYLRRLTKASIWLSFVWGVGFTVSNLLFGFIASPINAGAIAIVGSLIITPLASFIGKKLPARDMDELFACYSEQVMVTKRTALSSANHHQPKRAK